jgi:hypothetical protein
MHESTSSELLREASLLTSSSDRLNELYKLAPSLGSVIASNPSASIQLLDQLASQCPAEVLANPILQLRSLEASRVYGAFSLRSLVCLSLVCDSQTDTQLLDETKRRMHEALDQLHRQEWVGLSCIWFYQCTFTLQPDDCDGLIDHDLELSLEHRAFVDGDMGDICSAIPQLACDDPDLVQSQRAQVADFLKAIDNGTLNSYVDSQVDPDGDREHKGHSITLLTILGAAGRFSTEGSLLVKEGEPILEFHALINEFDSIGYKDGVVWVAVGEHEESDREYQLSLGELQLLRALAEQSRHVPDGWHKRLALLLVSRVTTETGCD